MRVKNPRGLRALLLLGSISSCAQVLELDGTYETRPSSRQACALPSDCPNGQSCLFGSCSPVCKKDVDCPLGARCLNSSSGGACVTAPSGACTPGGNPCPSGTLCAAGQCRSICDAINLPCLEGQACVGSVCVGADVKHDPAAGTAGQSGAGGAGAGGQTGGSAGAGAASASGGAGGDSGGADPGGAGAGAASGASGMAGAGGSAGQAGNGGAAGTGKAGGAGTGGGAGGAGTGGGGTGGGGAGGGGAGGGLCGGGDVDAPCPCLPGLVCDLGTNKCVACLSNKECQGNTNSLGNACYLPEKRCGCNSNTDCVGHPSGPHCGPDNICSCNKGSAECASSPLGNACLPGSFFAPPNTVTIYQCGCSNSAGCPALTGCDVIDSFCQPLCKPDGSCPDQFKCDKPSNVCHFVGPCP